MQKRERLQPLPAYYSQLYMKKVFKDMEKEEKYKQKRKVLISLSHKAEKIREHFFKVMQNQKNNDLAMYWASRTINSILMERLYNKKGNLEFKTFHQWKAEGKTILKGSKAYLVWAQPLNALKEQEAAEKDPNTPLEDEEGKYKYFPVCYLFSNEQVK